jgi:hypothetical protein
VRKLKSARESLERATSEKEGPEEELDGLSAPQELLNQARTITAPLQILTLDPHELGYFPKFHRPGPPVRTTIIGSAIICLLGMLLGIYQAFWKQDVIRILPWWLLCAVVSPS